MKYASLAAALLLFTASAASADGFTPVRYDSQSETRYNEMTARDCAAVRARGDSYRSEEYSAREEFCERNYDSRDTVSQYMNDPTVYKGAPTTNSAGNRNYDYW